MRPHIWALLVKQPKEHKLEEGGIAVIELPYNCVIADPYWPGGPRWHTAEIIVRMTEHEGVIVERGDYRSQPPPRIPIAGMVAEVKSDDRKMSSRLLTWRGSVSDFATDIALTLDREQARQLAERLLDYLKPDETKP